MLNVRQVLSSLYGDYLDHQKHSALSSSDIVIFEFPKSGVTYFSFLISNYLLLHTGQCQEVNFFNLNSFVQDIHRSPSLDQTSPFTGLPFRFVKSHSAPKRLVVASKIVIIRNPLRTLISYYRHLSVQSVLSSSCTLIDFIQSPSYGIDAWIKYYEHHLSDSNPLGLALMSYESNVRFPESALESFCHLLGIKYSPEIARNAYILSDMDSMKKSESTTSRAGLVKRSSPFVAPAHHVSEELLAIATEIIQDRLKTSDIIDLVSPQILDQIGLS